MRANQAGLHARRAPARLRRGATLIVILASLALIMVMVVAFLLMSRMQLTAAKSSAQGDAARLLADRCVSIVIAQLTDATMGAPHLSWASQPGAVRTYDDRGAPVMAYKLFSSDNLRVAGPYNPSQDALDTSLVGWSQQPGLYTDLNEPITVNGLNSYTAYPIADPSAAASVTGTNPVEGFSINGAPVETSNPLPMPVQWLYVLQDGSLVLPQPGGGNGVDAVTVPSATPENPIIGRIAFWTDDETSKVNINTSSEGTFWDTPRAEGQTERNYALHQPATGEFQRYPGHPAMTSLSGIFPALAAGPNYPEILYPLIPRLAAGGSTEGTQAPGGALIPNDDRLYASADEFMFNPKRAPNNPLIDNTALRKARFFLTANSRAPEVNLFGKPRVTIWPISADLAGNPSSPYTTATDRLIAFASTMRNDLATPYRYFFQRQSPDSPTADISSIPRNGQLYQYLQNLTSLPVPGFGGGGILSKYGADQNQILTEIFDYIRSADLEDGNLPAANQYSPSRTLSGFDAGEWAYAGFTAANQYYTGQGLVCPTSYRGTRGFGRFPTVSKVGLWFIVSKLPAGPGTFPQPGDPTTSQVQVQAALLFDMFDPSLGWVPEAGGYTLQVSVTPTPTWGPSGDATHALSSFGTIDIIQNPGQNTAFGSNFGGRMGFSYLLDKRSNNSASPTGYPFISTLNVPNNTSQLSYSDINLTITILYNGNTVQTLQAVLPGAAVPMPTTPSVGASSFLTRFGSLQSASGNLDYNIIQPEDVVQTVQCASGDVRLIAGTQNVSSGAYAPHPSYGKQAMAHSLFMSYPLAFFDATGGKLVPGVTYSASGANTTPDVPAPNGVFAGGSGGIPGDWDNPISQAPDGPYINKPDEGSSFGTTPYFDNSFNQGAFVSAIYATPNRQMPSPGMFGSLSTGVARGLPWQTLLFRPGPAGHPGQGVPAGGPAYATLPDFLLLDLFQMPVAEPYALTEPFSTAGKVNMNYQIVPFSYITRETAIRAALKKEMIMAIPNSAGPTYKSSPTADSYRFPINLDETLKGFQQRFANHDLFRSASEICSIYLVPGGNAGATYASMPAFWTTHALTGDNSQERPYTNIYQRLTTKSNTYTVHFRVQLLSKPRVRQMNNPTEFDESKGDAVAAEYRGSSVLERYIDPNDPKLPDFATAGNDSVVDSYYHVHILSTKQFNP